MSVPDKARRVRLGAATIDRLPAGIVRPAYPRERLQPGILHLGVGAFHRCHQAEWTDDALQADFGAWGIVGVNLRAPDLRTMLADQDGYFCRITRNNGVDHVGLVGSMVRVASVLGTEYDPHRLTLASALTEAVDPRIRVITMTITEKGYCHVPSTGALDEEHPDIRHDRDVPHAPVSAPGFIVRVLATRRARGLPTPVMISCDNVPDNGATLRRCVLGLARMIDGALADAIERDALFLNTMVDRIVPATLDEDVERFAAATGLEDYGLVVGEPFRMWVIEKPAGVALPSWDKAGALFVDHVAPYEVLKMRVLNGIQSNVCQLGALSGLPYMADVMALPEFRSFAETVTLDEVVPCLEDVPGIDLRDYVAQSIARLSNPDLKHRTAQISTDGSRKIKQRLLEPVRSALGAGIACDGLLLGVAGWMQHATGMDHRGQPVELHDPLADRTRDIGRQAGQHAEAIVRGMLSLDDVFGTDLLERPAVVGLLVGFMAQLLQKPAREVVRDFVASRAG